MACGSALTLMARRLGKGQASAPSSAYRGCVKQAIRDGMSSAGLSKMGENRYHMLQNGTAGAVLAYWRDEFESTAIIRNKEPSSNASAEACAFGDRGRVVFRKSLSAPTLFACTASQRSRDLPGSVHRVYFAYEFDVKSARTACRESALHVVLEATWSQSFAHCSGKAAEIRATKYGPPPAQK
ncbi:hypothetical protein BDZ89DRAFT_465128 [Hymenopellis radicata]|nr:hypothetical protein BDZ89DRAFT_465128 [Hymenopellis radicata]